MGVKSVEHVSEPGVVPQTMKTRVGSVDVLRGVALLGILVMNAQSFSMPHVAYFNPSAYGSLEGLEGVAFSVGRLFFDFKFITLFSVLFGASLALAPAASRPRHRLGWLLVIGCVHGYLIWFGDVLFTYAVVGLIVLGARGWPARRLFVVGLGLLFVSSIMAVIGALAFDSLPATIRDGVFEHYDPARVAAELAAFKGSWLEQLPVRAAISFDNQTTALIFETGWRAAGCMLIGMAAVKAQVFEAPERWWRASVVAFVVGTAVTSVGLWLQWSSQFDFRTWLWAQALHEVGSIGMAAGYGIAGVTLANRTSGALLTRAIGKLGRVAFSAYLMHSIVGTLVFGGHGLGLFGSWSRLSLLLAPAGLWAAQLVMAWWWTSRYAVGPLEAVWRGLSRGDFSLHRRSSASRV